MAARRRLLALAAAVLLVGWLTRGLAAASSLLPAPIMIIVSLALVLLPVVLLALAETSRDEPSHARDLTKARESVRRRKSDAQTAETREQRRAERTRERAARPHKRRRDAA